MNIDDDIVRIDFFVRYRSLALDSAGIKDNGSVPAEVEMMIKAHYLEFRQLFDEQLPDFASTVVNLNKTLYKDEFPYNLLESKRTSSTAEDKS